MNTTKNDPSSLFLEDKPSPDWFRLEATRLTVSEVVNTAILKMFTLTAKMVRVNIHKNHGQKLWIIAYEIFHPAPFSRTDNRTSLTDEELAAAFGIVDSLPSSGQKMLRHYSGDVAFAGKFIRWGPFLNIPCPGTACAGDPNVSIFVTDEIREIIRKFLEAPVAQPAGKE